MFNCDDEDCGAGSNYEAAVNDWMLKCLAQDSLPEGQRYIDDFILMIQNLEAQLGYTIDVLFCLNIVTANAAENKAALDLLVSNGIQVTGVEMGNETYGQSSGFNSFNSYLTYIQNADGLLGDQDYIGMVRQYFPEMKIGVCAAPIATIDIEQGPGITYFINPEIKRIKYDDWNIALGNTWDSSRLISSPVPYTAPLFDAAIVHFYYTSDFWSDCSVQFLEDYDTYGAACCPYTFDTPDLRLAAAFDCFSAQSKYFRDSLYKSINDYYADRLQLNNPIHINKKYGQRNGIFLKMIRILKQHYFTTHLLRPLVYSIGKILHINSTHRLYIMQVFRNTEQCTMRPVFHTGIRSLRKQITKKVLPVIQRISENVCFTMQLI